MASSTIPTPGSAGAELVPILGFPQLDRRNSFADDAWRARWARATNNRLAFRLINQRYIQALRTLEAPKLNNAGKRVAHDLRANGIAFADFSEFFKPRFLTTIRECFDQYHEAFKKANPEGGKQKGKTVFLDTIHKAHTFVPDDAVSDYLGEPAFAAISARYMGMVPRFVGSSFWHTREVTGENRLYSQAWHRDYNDRMLVKVFLYLSDVGPQEGYFEYFAASHLAGSLGHTHDAIGDDGFRAYPDNDAVEREVGKYPVIDLDKVPAEQRSGEGAPWHGKPVLIRCMAPKGTLIFADTFGLHRGGYVRSGHRDMVMTTYSTNFNVHKPHFCVTQSYAERLTPFMRMSFGLR